MSSRKANSNEIKLHGATLVNNDKVSYCMVCSSSLAYSPEQIITVNEACPTTSTSRFDRIPYRHPSCALTHSPGFFAVAPMLLGHGFRLGTDDFHSNTLAEDLTPYLTKIDHDAVVGHLVGEALATILTSSFPTSRKILVILVNPPLEFAPEVIEEKKME